MNCQDALSLLYDLIDKETSEIDTKELQEHFNKCRHCFERHRLEASVQDFINEKLRAQEPEYNLERLKGNILSQLDEVDAEDACNDNNFPYRRAINWVVAVAVVVVMIGVGYFGLALYQHQANYIPIERAHWAAVDRAVGSVDSTTIEVSLADARKQFGYDLSHQVGDYSMTSGMSEKIMGVDMAHFVYTNNGSSVSVFLAPIDNYAIPSDLEITMVEHNGRKYFDHHCEGCRLVFHLTESAIIITASADHDVELLDFVPGHSTI